MTANDKISKSLKSTITFLENSMLALNKKDENSFANNIWQVAAELEYMLFLFSMSFQDEVSQLKCKPNPELKKAETSPILVEVQNLLYVAEKYMETEKSVDAYKNAYIARHYVLNIQENLAKKKREALKKK